MAFWIFGRSELKTLTVKHWDDMMLSCDTNRGMMRIKGGKSYSNNSSNEGEQ